MNTNYTLPKDGAVYPKDRLRPFDLEIAKTGHPLADLDGNGVRRLRDGHAGSFAFDHCNTKLLPSR